MNHTYEFASPMAHHKPHKLPAKPRTRLASVITDMVLFFHGFEYGETVVHVSPHDYEKHTAEFKCGKIGGFPYKIDRSVPEGQIILKGA